jgi:twitching motility protein PilT
MEHITELILSARQLHCSDIHLSEGLPLMLRINGVLKPAPFAVAPDAMRAMILETLDPAQQAAAQHGEDVDTALATPDGYRQRVNVFHQQGKLAATIRLLNDAIPTLSQLGLPPVLGQLAELPRGLVLVTGPTGSGKSTTLASMIQQINHTRSEHILTIEDPIEYVYPAGTSLIHQREIGRDAASFAAALRSALREDPDIILVGEMRDYETISAALTAAETGHLVLSTLHTTGAAQTIDRIIDACPTGSQNQVRTQLAGVLKAVITQCLIPTMDGAGRVPATEVMINTDAIANMIRESKGHQIGGSMQAGAALGMHTLNGDLMRLVSERRISRENAMQYSNDKRDLQQFIG